MTKREYTMSKPILPYDLRVKIMELDAQGYSTDEISAINRDEAEPYVSSEKQLRRCIASIKGQRTKGFKPKK